MQQSLEELARGRTTPTIAHRLTTIRGADVIRADRGRLRDSSHDELMAKQGLYYQLYQMYTLDEANE